MAKLYFLGGEDLAKRDSKHIDQRAFTDAGGTPVVAIFNWTSATVDKASRYRGIMVEYFEELGASKIEFAELSDSFEEITQKIRQSDLVYLPGGDTRLLIERIRKAQVDSLLRRYDKIIVGNSAGALALCRECLLVNRRDRPETTIIAGFGLVDFSVEVHYTTSEDSELEKLSEQREIYAIPERCALLYDDGRLSFIGKVYLFDHGRKYEASRKMN